MEKTSSILESKEIYSVENILDDIALITSTDGKSGLLNIKTNEIVGSFDNYETKWDSDYHFYYQVKDANLDTLVDFKGKVIKIYNTQKKECIADNWLIMYNKYNEFKLMILLDHNNKFHIFEENVLYRTKDSIFDIEFDYAKLGNDSWRYEFIVQKYGKFGIYIPTYKTFIPEKEIIYDNIEFHNGLCIYTLNNKKSFDIKNNTIWFKDIIFDENKNIFYSINDDNSISVYCREKLLFTVNGYDKLKFISERESRTNRFLFTIEKDGKFGIISYGDKNILTETTIIKNILEPIYDKITWNENSFFLYKNGKMGIMKICNSSIIYDSQIKFVDTHYDEIINCGDDFYALKEDKYHTNLCDIININNPNNILVKNCEKIDLHKSTIIYEKCGKLGIFSKNFDKKKKSYFNIDGYDSITHILKSSLLYSGYFKIEKNGKFGIYKDPGQIIIEPIYDSIDIYTGNGSGLFAYRHVYFVVKNAADKYKLLRCSNYTHVDDLEYFNNNSYKDIIMLPDIIVLRNDNLIEVYDYNKKLVGKFNKNTIIEQVIDDNNKYYLVNDEYYFYKDGVFDKVHMTDTKTYSTMYECKYGTIVVNNYNKLTHDKVCENVESLNEDEIDNIMLNYYDKSLTLQKKYPTLKKKGN